MIMNRIQSESTIARHGHNTAVLFAVVLALAAFASAADMSSGHSHKKGNLKITAQTEVGGIVLQPGDYQVREIDSAGGPVVEFIHLFNNYTAQEGLPVYEQAVVGQVKVTEQALSSLPTHTQLQLASKTADAIGLVIRGDDVAYSFAPGQMSAEAETVCTNSGPQQ
jgi:hypothetical protein